MEHLGQVIINFKMNPLVLLSKLKQDKLVIGNKRWSINRIIEPLN